MSGERARDAIAQCLPTLSKGWGSWGYRTMADRLDNALEQLGFKVISIATYDRLTRQVTHAADDTDKVYRGHQS